MIYVNLCEFLLKLICKKVNFIGIKKKIIMRIFFLIFKLLMFIYVIFCYYFIFNYFLFNVNI